MTTPTDILRQAINFQLSNVNTSIPARIESYEESQKKASVKPLLKSETSTGEIIDLPVITNVPVIFPKGGNFSMQWPLNEGDTVLIIFTQRSLDEWLSSGGEVINRDPRQFSLSDAIAIPGLNSFAESNSNVDNENFFIEMGLSKLKISPSGTICFEGASEELMALIDELINLVLRLASTPTASPGTPIGIDLIPTLSLLRTRFNTLKGNC